MDSLHPIRAPILHRAPPGWRWRTISGDWWNCWCALEGVCHLRFSGRSISVRAGTCVLIPPRTRIEADHDIRHPVVNLAIHCDGTFEPRSPLTDGVVLPDPLRLARLAEDCLAAWEEDASEEYALLTRVLIDRMRRAAQGGGRQADPILAPLVLEIARYPQRPWSVSGCALQVKLSRSQFVRRFRSAYATSPKEFIARMRDEHALRLAEESHLPLSEIATLAGYSDAGHLGRRLRTRLGRAPGAWRRTLRDGALPGRAVDPG